jgi:ABC-type sugar transport system substrate-binding protein
MHSLKVFVGFIVLLCAMLGADRVASAQTSSAVDAVLSFDKTATKLQKKARVAYLAQCIENPYCQASLKGMNDAGAKYGFEVKVFNAGFNPATQLKDVQNAVAEKFDGYVFAPTAGAPGCSMYETYLKPTGKPVVVSDQPMCGDADQTQGIAGTVLMITQSWTDSFIDKAFSSCGASCTAFAIGGFPGTDLENVWETALAKAQKKYPNVKFISNQPGNFSPQTALRLAQDALSAHPNINLIISFWDDMSRGIVQAVTSAGKKPGKDVRIYSVGATRDGVDMVKAGDIEVVGISLPYEEGYYAGVAMAMALEGKPLNAFIDEALLPAISNGPKSIFVSKENVDTFSPNN